MTRRLAKIDTHAIGAVRADVATYKRNAGEYVTRPAEILYHDGETPADAEAFADALGASLAAYRAAHPSVPGSGYDASLAPVGRTDTLTAAESRRVAEWHAERSAAVDIARHAGVTAESVAARIRHDAGLAELAERFRTRDRAESRAMAARLAARVRAENAAAADAAEIAEVAEVARTLATSGPTHLPYDPALGARPLPQIDPAPGRDSEPEPDTYAAAIARVTAPEYDRLSAIVSAAMAEPAPEPVPDALTVCNACDVRPMVGPEHPGYAAGLCAECFAEANAPEPAPFALPDPVAPADALVPEPEPYQWIRPDIGTPQERAEVEEQYRAEQIAARAPAPVLAAVPAPEPRTRPTCERCGQTFRLSGNGYAWHVANRPDCAAGRSVAA